MGLFFMADPIKKSRAETKPCAVLVLPLIQRLKHLLQTVIRIAE